MVGCIFGRAKPIVNALSEHTSIYVKLVLNIIMIFIYWWHKTRRKIKN